MPRKKISPYADQPHVRVKYSIWDMDPPTKDCIGTALVPQSLIDKHGLQAAFAFTSGYHHRYIGLVQPGHVTIDGEPFEQEPAQTMRF
ncbi:hypothetical protein D3C71_157740 [compost metagenome]